MTDPRSRHALGRSPGVGSEAHARGPDPGQPVVDVSLTPDLRVRRWQLNTPLPRTYPTGAHPEIEVAWLEGAGELSYGLGGSTLTARAPGFVVLPRGVEHQTRITPGTVATSVWIRPQVFIELAEAMGPTQLGAFEPAVFGGSERLVALGRMLAEEANAPVPGRVLAATALTEALVIEVLRRAGRRERPRELRDARIAAAIETIEAAFGEALTLDDLARAAGMSRFHFSRVFAAQTGTSPHQFLIRTRLARSAEFLRSGRASVTEAAMAVGFADLSRFSKQFRRQFGCAPSDYPRLAKLIDFPARKKR